MPGESLSPHGEEQFSSKKLAAELQAGYAAEVAHGSVRPESSPIKQIERGEFGYDDVSDPDYVEVGHSSEMLQTIANKYFQEQPRSSRQVQYRYAQLSARDQELSDDEPRASIAIPIAIHNEDASTLQSTLTEIAAQSGVDQDEIFLYANMPDTLSEEEKSQARDKLDEVISQARQASPQLNLRSLLVEYEDEKLGIGRVRHDYMDLIAWDGARRGFGIDHPVIMLDADTKQMTKDAFEQLAEVLTESDSDIVMAHTETHYLFDNNGQENETGMADARKLAVLQEIRRRQFLRIETRERAESLDQDINEVYNQGHYDEEWGTAVALGPYLLVGGYDELATLDESRYLTQRLYDDDGSLYDVMQHAKPDIDSGKLYNGMYYLVGTSVRGSARRHEQRLREWVAGDVNNEHYAGLVEKHIQSGHQYQDFSHTDSLRMANSSVEPTFKDDVQAKMIVKSVLKPDVVPSIDGESKPMPDPTNLLRRLDLPRPDYEVPPKSDNN